ncbi:MAG: hypothetical protein QOG53_2147 [Frankiales bacterium]|jgi:3-hydroxy-3-methylglutaryl CoA synthase/uncharacterized OB-fold protein|nr:hypothetical protein [Frankiales bacterium]
MSFSGIVAYGAYVPYHRLDRSAIRAALRSGGGKGTRAVASYDEDSTSMGVEASRVALAGLGDRSAVRQLFFATASPAYLDKTNATAIHAALNLADDVLAVDMGGSPRSGVGAFVAAAQSPVTTLAVTADIRTGLPGSADESNGGDGAAAFVFGPSDSSDPVIAELTAHASTTEEFLDRWRLPGAATSRGWEERFGEEAYVPLAEAAVADALKQAALTPDQVDHVVVAGLHGRAAKAVGRSIGARAEAITPDRTDVIGNAGTAQAGLLLADVLDRAEPDQTILVVVLADGATALLLRTTDALRQKRAARSVADQIAGGSTDLDYAAFLTWRGFLDRETPRRPDPAPPYAPPALRRADWKFGFIASKCTRCGTRHLPPGRVCLNCRSVDEMATDPLADVPGTVATYTIDRLAYSLNPPMLVVVVDFDGGGRFRCELTDAAESEVDIGLRVEMTFRRLVTASGIHNYFWKARPARSDK